MSAILNYLEQLYLYEEIQYIDESFASWVKQLSNKSITDKLQMAAQRKDLDAISRIVSVIPKVDADKLRLIGKRVHKNFDRAYKVTQKEAQKQFPELSGDKLKYFVLTIAPKVAISEDMEVTARDDIRELKKKLREKGFKKFDSGAGTLGMFMVFLAGILGVVAIAHLSLFPLLIGIVVAAFAGIFILQGITS